MTDPYPLGNTSSLFVDICSPMTSTENSAKNILEDINLDITPRESILEWVRNGFPVQQNQVKTDESGKEYSAPMTDEHGNPIICQEAQALREAMIERLCALPPVQSAIDQLLFHFGAEAIAEITGRSKRLVKRDEAIALDKRPASANAVETRAFMDDKKRILLFSDAGGTGRSYHADLGCRNQRRRVHYLLEPGWRADTAIQGLGRSNRTNQAQPPVFRPVSTDIKGDRRFVSTISRRLDTLGAITRGQRQTGGQGLFRPEDNFESEYARSALRGLLEKIRDGKTDWCSLSEFEELTGLMLVRPDGGGNANDFPPMHRFLNRILACRIDVQNRFFEALETRLSALIDQAIEDGSYEQGIETIRAESIALLSRQVLRENKSGRLEAVRVRLRNPFTPLECAPLLAEFRHGRDRLMRNALSKAVAFCRILGSLTAADGRVVERCRLFKPSRKHVTLGADELARSYWQDIDELEFHSLWQAECAKLPAYEEQEKLVLCGLLLPVWKILPETSIRVQRMLCDDGTQLLGRVFPAETAMDIQALFGKQSETLSPKQLLPSLMDRNRIAVLGNGWRLKRSRIMGEHRLEIADPVRDSRTSFLAMGCVSEIIQHRARYFVPLDKAESVLAGVLAQALLAKLVSPMAAA